MKFEYDAEKSKTTIYKSILSKRTTLETARILNENVFQKLFFDKICKNSELLGQK